MSEQQASEAAPQMVTEQDLAKLDDELYVANAWLQNWEGRATDLALIRESLAPFVGHPVADVEAALEQAQLNLAEAEADLAAKNERLRDIQGYIRIRREQLAELEEAQREAGG